MVKKVQNVIRDFADFLKKVGYPQGTSFLVVATRDDDKDTGKDPNTVLGYWSGKYATLASALVGAMHRDQRIYLALSTAVLNFLVSCDPSLLTSFKDAFMRTMQLRSMQEREAPGTTAHTMPS